MTKIKLCGLSRPCDVEAANELKPEYIGFVFAPGSRRAVSLARAAELKRLLDPEIQAVGVFVNEAPEQVAALLNAGVIDLAQLHGSEREDDIGRLRRLTDRPVIKAFRVATAEDIQKAEECTADYVLLDSGSGSGAVFDWSLVKDMKRPYFLAGGLTPENVAAAVGALDPYAVDVSSGIETDGVKDQAKMAAFIAAARTEDRQ